MSEQTEPRPVEFSVARGNPTDEELGAVMAVLAAASQDPIAKASDERPLSGGWKSHWRRVRRPLLPGREAWRAAFRP
ncbi:MAG TPA: acyl-CoA carboxylase subunit epsilon [Propionibacteriaceae bacterium]|nr:acyl-CoA carboxylase subunit epsilon [Propionibacteriaceae bacterium]